MPTDEILVRKALAGDKEAFGKLVGKYDSAVYGLAYHLVGNFTDAQDLAQQAFISAYTKLHQLKEHKKFASWLRAITTNICRMWLRKRREEITSLEAVTERKISENQPSPEELVIAKEERDFVRQLSTFQHIPKEAYSPFLEVFALADATEEKVRGLMKRLDAMLKMLR